LLGTKRLGCILMYFLILEQTSILSVGIILYSDVNSIKCLTISMVQGALFS
jgi:hypothetical protein